MELAHSTHLKVFGMNVNKRHGERFKDSHTTIDKDQSLSSEDQVTFTFIFSFSVNMDMEIDAIAAHNKFFITLFDRNKLTIESNI
mmetsp:Transcript_61906/g.85356  ORF Transcript_61906/g.85356 Transcript_61906/m.85356 type:complete len:85 (-) Transcript_61906:681-935(-)